MKLGASIFAIIGIAFTTFAKPISFDFKDPKGVNNIVFKLDARLESINGIATGVSGTVTYDPANPASLKGKLMVTADSLHMPNAKMEHHLQSSNWLDVAKFPDITFEVISVANTKTVDNQTTADVTGTFTLHGVSQKITVPVKMSYFKDDLVDRLGNLQGDVLMLRATFTIKRSDYRINSILPDSVAEEIELSFSVAGQAPR